MTRSKKTYHQPISRVASKLVIRLNCLIWCAIIESWEELAAMGLILFGDF